MAAKKAAAKKSANLFRPLPGTNFAWHQLRLTLATDTNHRLAEERVLRAVSGVVDGYRSTIERQHAEMTQGRRPSPRKA